MAEKVQIFELDINLNAAIGDISQAQKSIKTLKEEIKALEKTEGDHADTIQELTIELKLEQEQLRKNQKETINTVKATNEKSGSVNQLRAQLGVVTNQWNALSKKERENTDVGKNLSKQKLQLTNNLKKLEKATGDNRRNVGNYTSAFKGLGTQLLGMAGLTGGLTAAMGGLKNIINSTAEGQIFLAKVTGGANAVLNKFRDTLIQGFKDLVNFGEGVEDTRDLITKLGDGIENFYKVRAKGFLKFVDAGAKLLKGEFSDALTDVNDGFVQVTLGIENATEKSKELLNQLKIQAAFGAAISKGQKQLELDRSRFAIQEAKDLRKIAELREISADKAGKTTAERKTALQEALRLEKIIAANNEDYNNRELEFQKALFNAHESNIDDEIELNKIRKKNDEQQAGFAKKRKALIAELAALEKEETANISKVKADADKKDLENKRAKAKAEAELLKQRLEQEKEYLSQEQQRRATNEENALAVQEKHIFARLDQERTALEAQYKQEIAYAQKIGADVTLIEKKFSDARLEIDEAETNAKLSLAADFAGNIAQIAGEGTAIGKAAAVAQTAISTYQAATGAYASLAAIPIIGPVLGAAAAGAAIAAGLANVRKILAVKSGLPGESGGTSASIGGGAPSTPTVQRAQGIAPDINTGLVSRQGPQNNSNNINANNQVLVTDQVTVNQNRELANKETAVL